LSLSLIESFYDHGVDEARFSSDADESTPGLKKSISSTSNLTEDFLRLVARDYGMSMASIVWDSGDIGVREESADPMAFASPTVKSESEKKAQAALESEKKTPTVKTEAEKLQSQIRLLESRRRAERETAAASAIKMQIGV